MRYRFPRASSVRAARIVPGRNIATAPARRAPVKSPMCARRSSAGPSSGIDMESARSDTAGTAKALPKYCGGLVMENASAETAVTKVVDRIPREGMDAQLEQAMKNLIAAALKFPGHLGVTVTRPSLPAQPGFRMVYRFDSCEHLRAWEESVEYARLDSAAQHARNSESSCGDRARRADHELRCRAAAHPAVQELALPRSGLNTAP